VSVLPSIDDLPSSFVKKRDLHVAAEDEETTILLSRFTEVGRWIRACLDDSQCVLVHCAAGVSRSASLVTAFLMKYKSLTKEDALSHVKAIRPIVNPNPGFLRQLLQYQKALALLGDTDDEDEEESPKRSPKNAESDFPGGLTFPLFLDRSFPS